MADFSHLPRDFFISSIQFTRRVFTEPYPAVDPTKAGNSVKGKVVIITGSSRGIGGRGIAPAFAKAGAKGIVLVATDAKKLEQTEQAVHAINPDIETLVAVADISKKADVTAVFEKIAEKFKKVDILVNSAGVLLVSGGTILEEDVDVWWRNLEVNVHGTFLMTHAFLSMTKETATAADPASIITLVSSNAYQVHPIMSGYNISKLAAIQMGAHVAATFPDTVRHIAVNPALNETDMLHPAIRGKGFILNTPEMVGETIVWLAADPARSKFLSGRCISAGWDVNELVDRKEEITSKDLLTIDLKGTFGADQFK